MTDPFGAASVHMGAPAECVRLSDHRPQFLQGVYALYGFMLRVPPPVAMTLI